MPAKTKSAPPLKACRNALRGGMAPAAMTLNAIQGFLTVFMNSITSSALRHQELSIVAQLAGFVGPRPVG